MVDSFQECRFFIQFLHRVTCTSCSVTCVATETLKNVLKAQGSCYVNKTAMSHMHWYIHMYVHSMHMYACCLFVCYMSCSVCMRARTRVCVCVCVCASMRIWACRYLLVLLQETCHTFWPTVEGVTLDVGSMKITLVASTATKDFDSFKFTIQKPKSVSAAFTLSMYMVLILYNIPVHSILVCSRPVGKLADLQISLLIVDRKIFISPFSTLVFRTTFWSISLLGKQFTTPPTWKG